MCRRILTCLVVLLLLLAAAVGFLLWDLTRQAPEERTQPVTGAPAPAGRPAEPGAPPSRAADRLGEQLQGRRDPRRPDVRRYQVRITEQEANELLVSSPDFQQALQQAGIQRLQVWFEPGVLVAAARVPLFAGMKARLVLRGRLQARDGNLVYRTESISAGSLPTPAALREGLDRALASSVEQLNQQITQKLGGRLESVSISEDALEATGTRREEGPSR